MQNCSFEFIDNAGHFLMDEQQDLVAARIGRHLDAKPASAQAPVIE